jgi:hypothetical protein
LATATATPNTLAPTTTGNVVTITGTGTTWSAGTPGSPTFAISPTGGGQAITAQTVNSATQATLTVSTGAAGTITISESQNMTSCTITVQAAGATSFTMTAPNPTGAMAGQASGNFTVTPNGNYTGTITPSDGGAGGTFNPASLTWAGTATAKTFTYTASTSGNKSITATGNPALTAPGAITFAAIAAASSSGTLHRDMYGGLG